MGQAELSQYRWKSRILLLFAPAADDPRLAAQHAALADHAADLAERALVIVDDPDPALRAAFQAPAAGFTAVLLGLDGEEKLRTDEPIQAAALFATIDAMPMRQWTR